MTSGRVGITNVMPRVAPLCAALEYWARVRSDRIALAQPDAHWTFRQIAEMARAFARGMRRLGVGAGDVVSVQLPNWVEAFAMNLAAGYLGAVINPIIPIYREREVAFILRESKSKVLVIPNRYRGRNYADMLPSLSAETLKHVVVCNDRESIGAVPPGTIDMADLAGDRTGALEAKTVDPRSDVLLLYTSGTEANPKGVRLSHESMAAEAASMIADAELSDDSALFVASPLGHIAGVDFGVHVPVTLGAKVCLMDRWDADQAADLILREHCTWSTGVTPFLKDLLDAAKARGTALPLTGFRCGGADVPEVLVRDAHANGIRAYRTYGCTEHPTITGRVGWNDRRAATTDGRVLPGISVRIVDPEEPLRELQCGQVGEICTKGADRFNGYKDPALDAAVFDADGWFRTGDLGVLDDEGYITIKGRKKDIIIRKGENVSAKELEDLLIAHPSIDAVAVIGLADSERGERICAVVVPSAGAELRLADITDWLSARGIAHQKLPEQVELKAELPRTATGKIRKTELRLMYSGRPAHGGIGTPTSAV